MNALVESGDSSPLFSPIEIEALPALSLGRLEQTIRLNSRNAVPFLLDRKYPKQTEPLAIVAGGPSLNRTLDKLRTFKHVMACGTAHDYLIRQHIDPTYTVLCDSEPHNLAHPSKACTYLVATQCDPVEFERLADFTCLKWDMDGWVDKSAFEGRSRVNGGSTTAMRAPALGLILGFDNFHFFGVDSSFEDNRERHAYGYGDERESSPAITARINGKLFQTSLQWIQQAKDFQTLVSMYGHLFSVTVHGDGLLKAAWDDMRAKADLVFKGDNYERFD